MANNIVSGSTTIRAARHRTMIQAGRNIAKGIAARSARLGDYRPARKLCGELRETAYASRSRTQTTLMATVGYPRQSHHRIGMKNPGENWRLQGLPAPSSFICSRRNARCRLLIGPRRMPEGDGRVHVGRDALALPGPVSPAVPAPTPGWRNKWRPRRSTAAPPPRSAPRSRLVQGPGCAWDAMTSPYG